MGKACVAVDIGASSGRLIVGTLNDGKIGLEEIHRFKNEMYEEGDHHYWNIDHLFNEIKSGLKTLVGFSEDVESIGVDTWAVDYVLVDENNERVSNVFAYRDHRTDETMAKVFGLMSKEDIYKKTGIQFLQFNSLYQLFEHFKEKPENANDAKLFMMVPDYLNFCLSGVTSVEYTNATSTQMLDVNTNTWDESLIELSGFNKEIFPELTQPGTILGELQDEVAKECGINPIKVISPATHDTGSAVVSVPALDKEFAYISSGTWSLMGIESHVPIATELAGKYNFTNEGGVYGTYRVLKNIMGLWLIQEVQRMYDYKYSFAEFVVLAEESEAFKCLIDPNDNRFLNPKNMVEEIQAYCKETQQYVPTEPGEIARCIFESLGFQYREVVEQLREIQEVDIKRIHIIGGGCQNLFLNQICADFCQMDVFAGPIEATAIGNLLVQFITLGEIDSLKAARQVILDSFDIKKHAPRAIDNLEEQWDKFRRLRNGK